jgi:hypothetical protein
VTFLNARFLDNRGALVGDVSSWRLHSTKKHAPVAVQHVKSGAVSAPVGVDTLGACAAVN